MKTQAISLVFAGVLAACQSLPDGPPVVERVRFERAVHFETGEPLIGAVLELENRSRRVICVAYEVEGLGGIVPLDPGLPPGELLNRTILADEHLDGSAVLRLDLGRLRRPHPRIQFIDPRGVASLVATAALVPGAEYRATIIWEASFCRDGLTAEGTVIAHGPTGLRFTVPSFEEQDRRDRRDEVSSN